MSFFLAKLCSSDAGHASAGGVGGRKARSQPSVRSAARTRRESRAQRLSCSSAGPAATRSEAPRAKPGRGDSAPRSFAMSPALLCPGNPPAAERLPSRLLRWRAAALSSKACWPATLPPGRGYFPDGVSRKVPSTSLWPEERSAKPILLWPRAKAQQASVAATGARNHRALQERSGTTTCRRREAVKTSARRKAARAANGGFRAENRSQELHEGPQLQP